MAVILSEVPTIAPRKTKIFAVDTTDGYQRLGLVSWYAPWRKFTFNPAARTVFEEDCLREIADFCVKATQQRKAERV